MGSTCCSGPSTENETRIYDVSGTRNSHQQQNRPYNDSCGGNGPVSKRSSVDSQNMTPEERARQEHAQAYIDSIFSDFNQEFQHMSELQSKTTASKRTGKQNPQVSDAQR